MPNNIDAKAIKYFEKELDMIQDDTLKGFFYNALAVAPQSFHDDEDLLKYIRKTFHILRGMLETRRVEGAVRDALLGTVFLCDIMVNEFEEDMKPLHTVAVRSYLEKYDVHKDVQAGLWENVMRAVESHNGEEGASPILAAKPGTAEYEVANAFAVANLDYVTLDWEVINNEGEEQAKS